MNFSKLFDILFNVALIVLSVIIFVTDGARTSTVSHIMLGLGMVMTLLSVWLMFNEGAYARYLLNYRLGTCAPAWLDGLTTVLTFWILFSAGDVVSSLVWLFVGAFSYSMRLDAKRRYPAVHPETGS